VGQGVGNHRHTRISRVLAILALVIAAPLASATEPSSAKLPRYDLYVELDTLQHRADVRQRVTWTNTTRQPRSDLVFNFYPHYKIPAADNLLLSKTLEMLRMPASEAIDKHGRHGVVADVRLVSSPDGQKAEPSEPLKYSYPEDKTTALTISLPKPIKPGESVTIELKTLIDLPNKQGRWGHWQGVTFLTNALPVLAFCDDTGWRPMPFVPWHQPWFNEAGVYRATIILPLQERLACPAVIRGEKDLGDGRKQIETEEFTGRDFAILCSGRYQEFHGETKLADGRKIKLKCLAFPEHEWYATEILKIVGEAISGFSQWFGPFPYSEFTVAESYFGWNGNECAGLILIDERIFAMPHLARGYVEYLASHETCHQWWYNQVGTNGYSETFMDEAPATFFTHRLLDSKHGPNNDFMQWPQGMEWLPNMKRENYRWAYLSGAIRKSAMQPAAQDLPNYGHVFSLFTGAYDRGSRVLSMIEAQMGEAAFLDFIRMLVKKYSFKVIQVVDFRRDLEEYTGRDWGVFFDRWVYGKGMIDWSIEEVRFTDDPSAMTGTPRLLKSQSLMPQPREESVSVAVRQKGDFVEPTTVEFRKDGTGGYVLKKYLYPNAEGGATLEDGTVITKSPDRPDVWWMSVKLPSRPDQVTVDPDRVLMDSDLSNNAWRPTIPRFHATPLYTMLDETDLTNDYDRWNFGVGPWVGGALYPDPWYVRSTMFGVRAGAYRTQVFTGGIYAAYRTDYRDAVLGVDGLWDHCFHPRMQIGFNYEQRILEPIGTTAPSGEKRGSLFARYVLEYGPSLYLPAANYVDLFSAYSDNFLPFARTTSPGAVRPNWTQTTGLHYRLNMYTPYWDPEGGFWIDAWSSGGVANLGNGAEGAYEGRGELAAVRKLPDELGPILGETRAAARVVVQGATPNQGQFFALGGGTLFRGYDLAQRQGSLLWVTNLELRVPLARHVQWDVLDHVAGGRNLYLAGFYDVGAIYANGQQVGNNVAHAVGLGLRLDTAFFSFIERATLRVDVSKTINDSTPYQFWFGVQHAF